MTTTVEKQSRASRRIARAVVLWALQLALAAVFAAAGLAKLAGDAAMVEMFADIGAGQWLRFLVGGLEVAGAICLLVPLLAGRAAVVLGFVMVGATITNLVILGDSAVLPLALLLLTAGVAWVRRVQQP